jgi:two-component system sensor histidine kinase QseC
MTSIRRRLTLGLLGITVSLSLAVGVLLYTFVRQSLIDHFDASLDAKEGALGGLVKWGPTRGLELDFADQTMPEFSRPTQPEYFELWRQDGSVMERSRSLQGLDLRRPAGHRGATSGASDGAGGGAEHFDLPLPDGRRGRAALVRVVPHYDDEHGPPTAGHAPLRPPEAESRLTLVVARERGEIDYTLRLLLGALAAASALLCGAAAVLVPAVVRRSLRPLGRMAEQAADIDVAHLEYRFPCHGLPPELLPICHRFNDLLGRLDASFKRERRFTADVAHELRTPLAELRSLAEVGLKFPRQSAGDGDGGAAAEGNLAADASPADYDQAQSFRDTLNIARQMEGVVTVLLSIARAESGQPLAPPSAVRLGDVLRESLRPLAGRAEERGLSVHVDTDSAGTVWADPVLVRSMIDNLLSNAVEHATPGGSVECGVTGAAAAHEVTLTVTNSNDAVSAADLPHVCEPFWRKDAARTDGGHSGLGLSLVASHARGIGAHLRINLTDSGAFRVAVSFPTRPGTPSPASFRSSY